MLSKTDLTITKDNGTTHRCINSDFLEVKGLPKPDMVLCDLPYNSTQANWDRQPIDLPNMWGWLSPLRIARVPVCLWAALPFDKVLGCSNLKGLKYEYIWEKTAATGHLNAKKLPMKAHENCLVFYNKLPLYNPQKTEGHSPANSYTKHTSDGELYGKTKLGISGGGQTDRYPRTVWKGSSDKQKLNIHSTQKPLWFLRKMIRTYTNVGDTILDFTAGSMSLAVAAYLEGRNSICIEMDKGQFSKSVQWVQNCTEEDVYNIKG